VTVERWCDGRWKLHVARPLDRGRKLESGVERCGEGQGWCSPFIGVGGALRRRLPGVIADV
jgi:hypothetical protein